MVYKTSLMDPESSHVSDWEAGDGTACTDDERAPLIMNATIFQRLSFWKVIRDTFMY